MNRLKRKSGTPDPKSTNDKNTADAINTAEEKPNGEAQPGMVDGRQGSPDLPDDDSFEDAEEQQAGDHDAKAMHESSLTADSDGPTLHRLSLSTHSDGTPRESKFHEQLDGARE